MEPQSNGVQEHGGGYWESGADAMTDEQYILVIALWIVIIGLCVYIIKEVKYK